MSITDLIKVKNIPCVDKCSAHHVTIIVEISSLLFLYHTESLLIYIFFSTSSKVPHSPS